MKKKISIVFIALITMILIWGVFGSTKVQATLQSNPNTHYKKTDTASNWMTAQKYAI